MASRDLQPAFRPEDAGDPVIPKRLLHIIHSIAPASGGPTVGIEKLAEAASAEHGAEVGMELVCLDDPAAEYLQAHTFPIHALGPGAGHYGYTLRLAEWLRKNISRFDGAVIHGLWQYHSYGAYRILRGRLPYAVFPHGMLDPYFKRAFPLKHMRKQAYWLAAEYRVLRDARAVCFTSPIERDCSAGTMWPHRWNPAVVSFGTSAPPGDPQLQRAMFREHFPHLSERKFFLFLSRIHVKKGCDLAIDGFAQLADAHPDLDLVIAGPDPDRLRTKLETQAEARGIGRRVHWTGMLQGDLKWGAFLCAEAFVLPSHQENFGIAVVEAIACRRPVLISNKVNLWPDILEDAAGIVDDDTADGTCRSMSAFLALSPEERRRMGENGVRCFQKRYEMRRTAKLLNDLFAV